MGLSERFLLLEIVGCSERPLPPNETSAPTRALNDAPINTTPLAAAESEEEAISSLINTAVLATTLLLSCLNVLSNLASLLVFAHWKKRPVVQLLIFLCAAETLFNLGYSSLYAHSRASLRCTRMRTGSAQLMLHHSSRMQVLAAAVDHDVGPAAAAGYLGDQTALRAAHAAERADHQQARLAQAHCDVSGPLVAWPVAVDEMSC